MTKEQKQNWIEQRKRPQAEILLAIKTTLPAVWPAVAVVGKWIWVQFQKKPEAAILEGLKGLGFSWSSRRGCWQHPCGSWSGGKKGDPRERYGMVRAEELK